VTVPDGVADATAPDASLYYRCGYWNEYPAVAAEINRRITGDPARGYADYFHERIGRRTFARALFLNCGNGWVERDFLRAGIIDAGVGMDISPELLERARAEGERLPLSYVEADINRVTLPEDHYDLIVNFAAGHHVRYIDRVFRGIARSLTADGYFLSYDYVGPHRNQYPYEQWDAVWKLNRALLPAARQRLAYPHLVTMLATDPSEAIHSEMIAATYERYFTLDTYRAAGGALAYPLLTFNDALKTLAPADADEAIAHIMRADGEYLADHPWSTLFSFWYGRRKPVALADNDLLARWQRDELEREAAADRAGGRYYPESLFDALMNDGSDTGALWSRT
jgi:SAM-dependent methyltransferase